MDCSICFEPIKNSCSTICKHKYCYECLLKWINFGGTKCPLCKEFIYEINIDSEFINNENITEEYIIKKTLDFGNSEHPGITISSNNGFGIKITKLKKNDKFYKEGFRVNDIILFLNGVPCKQHSSSIKIIEYAYKNKKKLFVESLKKKINNF